MIAAGPVPQDYPRHDEHLSLLAAYEEAAASTEVSVVRLRKGDLEFVLSR